MFASGGLRRARLGTAVLLVALGATGCASTTIAPASSAAPAGTSVPRPADGNCTYVTAEAADGYLGHPVTAESVDAAPTDVDRCHYTSARADLSYSVSYFDDAEGASRALAAAGVAGSSAGVGDDSVLSTSDGAADLLFRWGPFLVTIDVIGSSEPPADVARTIAKDIRAHLG